MPRVARAVLTAIAPVYPVVVALLAWEAFARFGAANPRLFPGLGAIAEQAIILLRGHQLGPHLGASMTRVALGFGLAVVTGVPLGMLMSRSARFGRTVEPLFSLGYPVPRIALYPIAVFIFGIGSNLLEAPGLRRIRRGFPWRAPPQPARRAPLPRPRLVALPPALPPHLLPAGAHP